MFSMQLEKMSPSLFKEAKELTESHWDECACWKDKIKLDVDEERYLTLEQLGKAFCYTMRDNTTLVGYMVILFSPHTHYKNDIWGYVDVIFLEESYRKGLAAIRFMKYVEQEIKKRGASVMSYHVKTFHNYPAIFERLGFEKVEVTYAKCFKE